MKVLMLCSTGLRIGGWYRYVPLGQALCRRGATVTMVNTSPKNVLRFNVEMDRGVRIIEVPRLKGAHHFERATRLPWDILFRIGLVAGGGFDVVHGFGHMMNSAFPLWSAPVLSRRTVTIYDREDLWRDGGLRGPLRPPLTLAGVNDRIDNWFEAHTGRLTDAITAVSEDLRARTVAHGYDPERIYYLPNGCRTDEFAPGDAGAARAALELPAGRPILLYVAVGTYDASLVLDVMQMLPALGHPGVLAVMLGLIGDDVKRDIARRGLNDDVLVRGWVDTERLRLYLQAADVGLMPQADTPFNRSRFPIKVGDYLASGLPVATMRVGEVGRLVDESGAGVATAADAEAYGRGIADLLNQPRQEMQRLARLTAEGLSWDVVAARAEDIYRRTIAGRAISRGRRVFPSMLAGSAASSAVTS
jgi:glycosyltransferase involved in cell wall biosynthesis